MDRYCTECGCNMGRLYDPPIRCDACCAHEQGYKAGVRGERGRCRAWLAHSDSWHAVLTGINSGEWPPEDDD